jgi:glutaredoxin
MNNVQMYTLSTCAWCRKTKKFFAEHHIPFEFTDYDLADVATQARIRRELTAGVAGGFPFVRIGDRIVEGYQPSRFRKLLEGRESCQTKAESSKRPLRYFFAKVVEPVGFKLTP